MQAIQTKTIAATTHKSSRITAKCEAGTLTMPYDHAIGWFENHATAAALLIEKLGWTHQYTGGEFGGCYYWSPIIDQKCGSALAKNYSLEARAKYRPRAA